MRLTGLNRRKQLGMNWGTPFGMDPTGPRLVFPRAKPNERDVVIWNIDKNEANYLVGHESKVSSVLFSFDGQYVASGDMGGIIRIWDADTRTLHHELEANASLLTMAGSPNRDLFVAYFGGQITAWEMSTGRQMWSVESHGAEEILLTADGRMFVAGGHGNWEDPGMVTVWDVTSKPFTLTTLPQPRFSNALSYWQSANQKMLAVADRGSQIVIYDATQPATLRRLHELRGHTRYAYRIEFAPTGDTLISSAHDGTIRMWSTLTGQHVGTISDYLFSIRKFLPASREEKSFAVEVDVNQISIREIDENSLDEEWMQRVR